MNTRVNGIVIDTALGHEWASGTVRVSDTSPWHGHELPLVSYEETVPLVPGLKLCFFVAEINEKGAVALGAMLETPKAPKLATVEDVPLHPRSALYALGERAVLLAGEKRNRKDSAVGIGGARHQFIQRIVRDLAHDLGFKAVVEQQIPGGSVDVAIEGKALSIACEVPVTTKYHEWKNIKKCLDAGYHYVISVSLDADVLETVKRGTLQRLTDDEKSRVFFFFPEQLDDFLREIQGNNERVQPTQSTCRGYKVKVTHVPGTAEELVRRRSKVARVLASAIVRERSARPHSPE